MGIQIKVGRRELPVGLPTIEEAQRLRDEAAAAAETAAADAVSAALVKMNAALQAAAEIDEAVNKSPQSWADFQISQFTLLRNGVVVQFNGVAFVRQASANVEGLAAGPGWVPFIFVSAQHFGALGDGIADDTLPLQHAVNYSCQRRVQMLGLGTVYRCTSTINYGSNWNYMGLGVTWRMDYQATGHADSFIRNVNFNSTTKDTDIKIASLWVDATPSARGLFFLLVTGDRVSISDMRTLKTMGGWTTAISCSNLRMSDCHLKVAVPDPMEHKFGDCLHITQGENIVVSNCIFESNSDDAIALHAHQEGWSVNGKYKHIRNVLFSNCIAKSRTNSVRVGFTDDGSNGEYTSVVEHVQFANCYLQDGFQFWDGRTQSSPLIGPITFTGCTIKHPAKDAGIVRSKNGRLAFSTVRFIGCDLSTTDPFRLVFDAEYGGVETVVFAECSVIGRVSITGAKKVAMRGTSIASSHPGGAVRLGAETVEIDSCDFDSTINQTEVGWRGIHFSGDVGMAQVTNSKIRKCNRGIEAAGGTVQRLDINGTIFSDIVTNVLLTESISRISAGEYLLYGTGSPEGVVTARVGTDYVNLRGGAGVTRYRKESNSSGNTGWIAK